MMGLILLTMCMVACVAVRKPAKRSTREEIAADNRRNLADSDRWMWRA